MKTRWKLDFSVSTTGLKDLSVEKTLQKRLVELGNSSIFSTWKFDGCKLEDDPLPFGFLTYFQMLVGNSPHMVVSQLKKNPPQNARNIQV